MFEKYPDVVTVPEVQQMIRKGRNKVYELINSNAIKADRRGKNFIIPKYSVINYIKRIAAE
jgi:hypothetical protein